MGRASQWYVHSSNITNTIADGTAELYLDAATDKSNFTAYVGSYAGFVLNQSISTDVYSIENSTSDVDVLVQNKSDSINTYFGGFVGALVSTNNHNTVTNKVENSYSTGNFEISTNIDTVIGTSAEPYESYYSYIGGFVGYIQGYVDVVNVYTINNFVLSNEATYDDEYKGGIVGLSNTQYDHFGESAY